MRYVPSNKGFKESRKSDRRAFVIRFTIPTPMEY